LFVCPACRGPLEESQAAYTCHGCKRPYPIVAGIPDFRLRPDPWIGIPEDREKAMRVAEATHDLPFPEAVRRYWDMTPDTPRERVRHFVQHAERSLERSREWIGRIAIPAESGTWIDLGAGTGDLAAAAGRRGLRVVAIDIALRWLVIARRRPELEGSLVVCCAAEQLPFPDRSFAGAFSLGLLEHCPAPEPVAREARRVLVPGSHLRLRTVNRYSMLGEPHVGLWGVGLVPRRHADAYVRWRTGQRYQHHRPLSPREVARALRVAGFSDVRVEAASPLRTELGTAGRALRFVYDLGRRVPGIRTGVRWTAPLLEAEARA
jgi:SAM-dependent methyltransferase